MSNLSCPLPADPARLLAELRAERSRIAAEATAIRDQWEEAEMRATFRPSARNLATYLAFRHADLTRLQPDLAALGLSSLGRAEPHVCASLDAVEAALVRLSGGTSDFPAPERFTRGPARLAARRDTAFGTGASGAPRSRILVTLPGEAATDPDLIPALIAAGADAMRINCAHDGPEAWQAMIARIRAAQAAAGRYIPVLMDLAGPKLRIAGVYGPDKPRLRPGDRLDILPAAPDATPGHVAITLSHPALLDRLAPGMAVFLDDGKIGAEVVTCDGSGATLRVTRAAGKSGKGAKVKPEKGFNLPGVEIDIPALTEADRAALDLVVGRADLVGFSFVQTPEDIRLLIAEIDARLGPDAHRPGLVLKIETALALRNLPRLIVQAGALTETSVMIARGDLAVEIGLERLSEIQEEILWLCEAAHTPVVWATQVLEAQMKDGLATRAETTDAAMAQRADCVMLNKGPFAVETIRFLSRVLGRMDRHMSKKSARLAPLRSWRGDLRL
ncbi:pyruvate kinase [Celeribacter indicus]|uniref:Pyruvate kinase n=1 Tax=Celeribacter indicus TaxID=1208324 RepID=A0A0B5E2N1_9RHOB|nr:pyruvate kinase [Celeribacter indicus]AJE47635.1 pyruvate kinase [Celeribacter indicus]SDW12688.1 pyruvate kinase [Celeribacter indicus]